MSDAKMTGPADFAGLGAGIDTIASPGEAVVRRSRPMTRALYGDLIQFIDFSLVTIASIGVAYFYLIEVLIVDFDWQRYATAGIIGATSLTTLLRRDGFYEFEALISASRAMRAVLARWLLTILGLIAFAFALKISDSFSRFWLFTWAGVSLATLIAARIAAAAYLRRAINSGGAFARRVAVFGANELAARFIAQTEKPALAVRVVGVYALDGMAPPRGFAPRISGDIDALEAAARAGAVDDIVVAISGEAPSAQLAAVIRRLSDLPVSIAILPGMDWLDHQGGEVVRIAGAPALTLYRRPLEGWGGILKILEDRVLGVALFVAAAPVLLACAIALRLQGPGPIFFRQNRHGFNHEVFRIYKFRTMTVAEDGDVVTQATRQDRRITPVGGFLRKWSLDELPQLINVMRGEMSLVGPRPHALAHNHEYAQLIENYSGRHKVKPGITGWAQVNGFRGETSETEQMANRVRFDLEYIDDWSVWFDLKILVLTIAAVLFPKNAH